MLPSIYKEQGSMKVNTIILAITLAANRCTAQDYDYQDYGDGDGYEQDNLYQDYAMKQDDKTGGGG